MAFKVRRFPGAPDFETLHVAKITEYPLEKRDYKPYAQARICFAGDGMHLQLLAFEAEPLPESKICAVLKLTPNAPLVVALSADGSFSVYLGEDSQLALESRVTRHTFTGEDLQGVFWGGNFFVPQDVLGEYFSEFEPLPGAAFSGNFYKLCENTAKPHSGGYYRADYGKPLDAAENLGDFIIIDY